MVTLLANDVNAGVSELHKTQLSRADRIYMSNLLPVLRIRICLLILFCGYAPYANAQIQERAEFLSEPYPYIASSRPLQAVFADFSRLIGIPAILGREVRGTISVRNESGTVGSFLDSVAAQNALVWWRDGEAIHIDSASAVRSDLMPLSGVSEEALRSRLAELDLTHPRFTIRATADGEMVRVAGPDAYRAAVSQVIESLTTPATGTPPAVFRGSRSGG